MSEKDSKTEETEPQTDDFQQVAEKAEIVQNPKIGIFYMSFYVFNQSLNWLSLKYIFIYNPTLIGVQIVFARNIISTLVTIICVNKRIKYCMWDSIENSQQFMLIFQRCLQGFCLKVMQFSAIKYYTLTTFAIFYNLDPFFTLLLGAIILNESIKPMDIFLVFISFTAVVIISFGMKSDDDHKKVDSADYAKSDHFNLVGFICLIGVPVLVAC